MSKYIFKQELLVNHLMSSGDDAITPDVLLSHPNKWIQYCEGKEVGFDYSGDQWGYIFNEDNPHDSDMEVYEIHREWCEKTE